MEAGEGSGDLAEEKEEEGDGNANGVQVHNGIPHVCQKEKGHKSRHFLIYPPPMQAWDKAALEPRFHP